ncbi:MAG: mannose-1-phosphate guanylyltransferase [Ignavibacteriales bacterium]|nr:mannose-1-phosphate guanylyltransferase [Ignavibacteriales bacterium]
MNIYAVIMAGGVGSRFWPRSKGKKPKQLLRIFGDNTMIQATFERVKNYIPNENIFVITNEIQKERIIQQLPDIPVDNIVAEPFGKNTAACIGLAAILVQQKDPNAVIVNLPADHLIKNIEVFENTIKIASDFAFKSKGIVTIGINPSRPETGYGYIQINDEKNDENVFKVKTFAEKPNYETAVSFLESGDFFWNSGMFICSADAILSEIQKYLPDLHSGLEEIKTSIGKDNYNEVLRHVYGQLKSISIDYGVMEKSDMVYLVKGNFDWSDVGSWEEVYKLSEKDNSGNALVGDVYIDKTCDSYIFSPNKFTAVIGVNDLIIVNTKNALLVCNRNNSQDVKQIIEYLKLKEREELL